MMSTDLHRVGMLVVSSDGIAEMDFKNLLPRRVPFFTARLYHNDQTPRGIPTLDVLVSQIESGIATIEQVRPELVVFACTSGSFYKGYGWDDTLTRRIASAAGVPGLVTSTAVRKALGTLGAQKLFMLTPYPDDVNALEVEFFRRHGLDIIHRMHFECGLARDIAEIDPSEIINALDSREQEIEQADAILISCTALRAVDVIDEVEKRFNRPVVTSNQATAWAILRELKVRPEREAGALFRHLDF